MSVFADWLSDSSAEGSHGLAAWLCYIERSTPMPTNLQSGKAILGWMEGQGLPEVLRARTEAFLHEWLASRRRRRIPRPKRGRRVGITLKGSTPRLDDLRGL